MRYQLKREIPALRSFAAPYRVATRPARKQMARKGDTVTDIVLRDIDPQLAQRIQRISQAQGWSPAETLLQLLEQGLVGCESAVAARLNESEANALQTAIAALEQVPNDPGFALIGRAESVPDAPEAPDQSIAPRFELG